MRDEMRARVVVDSGSGIIYWDNGSRPILVFEAIIGFWACNGIHLFFLVLLSAISGETPSRPCYSVPAGKKKKI